MSTVTDGGAGLPCPHMLPMPNLTLLPPEAVESVTLDPGAVIVPFSGSVLTNGEAARLLSSKSIPIKTVDSIATIASILGIYVFKDFIVSALLRSLIAYSLPWQSIAAMIRLRTFVEFAYYIHC